MDPDSVRVFYREDISRNDALMLLDQELQRLEIMTDEEFEKMRETDGVRIVSDDDIPF